MTGIGRDLINEKIDRAAIATTTTTKIGTAIDLVKPAF